MKFKRKSDVELATTLSITTTYVGEAAGEYISASLLSASTLDNDLITVKPNVQKSMVIKKLAIADILSNASCDFTASGSVTLTERSVTPKDLQVNLEICKTPFVADWEAMQMGFGVGDRTLPPKFSDYFLGEVAAIVAEAVEQTIWHGDADTDGEFNGLVTQLLLDATVQDVASSSITATNVIAELTKVYNKIPDAVFGAPDLGIYVAPNVYRAYQLALSALGFKQEYYVGNKPADFAGLPVYMINGLTANYMVAGQKSNLWFATALLSDMNQIKLIDMADIDGSQNVRVVMRFSADTNYGIGSEVVLYAPAH